MKYIGNKTRLLGFIDEVILKENLPTKGTFIDIFTGTTSVAEHFKKKNYKIISNDFMTYSYVYQRAFIKSNDYPKFSNLIKKEKALKKIDGLFENPDDNLICILNFLNSRKGKKGYFYNNFAPGGKYKRKYFSDINAQKIDEVRDMIQQWFDKKWINIDEYYFLVAIVIESADFVANIAGTYGAHLKIWRSMALKDINFKKPTLTKNKFKNDVYQKDSNDLIKKIKGDILYVDPPYNSRQYAPNFHVLETLACWDKIKLNGKTGLRPYEHQKSDYCLKNKVHNVFENLIKNSKVKFILLSYNNEGIMDPKIITKILQEKGKLKKFTKKYRRFRTERDHEKRKYKVKDDLVEEKLYLVKI